MDGQGPHTCPTKHPTSRQVPPADGVALERLAVPVGLDGADERVVTRRTLLEPFRLPGRQVAQRAGVPPQGDGTRPATFRAVSQPQVRPGYVHDHVVQLEPSDLGHAQSAAARQADDDEVAPGVGGALCVLLAVCKNPGQLATGQDLGLFDVHGRKAVHGSLRIRRTSRPQYAGRTPISTAGWPEIKLKRDPVRNNWVHFLPALTRIEC